jgi:hypothetical protein
LFEREREAWQSTSMTTKLLSTKQTEKQSGERAKLEGKDGDEQTVRALPGRLSNLGILHSKSVCVALLYGRRGRSTTFSGGVRHGQGGQPAKF